MTRTLLAAALLLVIPVSVRAEAPPAGSPQADAMAPYADWVRGLTNPRTGQGCCSLSDCRIVEYRVTGAGYEAFIDRATFPGAPDRWLRVPDDVVVHGANPTGFAVACWAAWHKDSDGWFCFTPSSAT